MDLCAPKMHLNPCKFHIDLCGFYFDIDCMWISGGVCVECDTSTALFEDTSC
jgi:hypothetical protein